MEFKRLINNFDHWTLLFGLVVMVSSPIWTEILSGFKIIFQIATFVVILSGISVLFFNSSKNRFNLFFGVTLVGLAILALIFPYNEKVSNLLSGLKILYFLIVSFFLLRSIFLSKEVGIDTMVNAISGYILLGISFAILISLWNTFYPGSFNFSSKYTQEFGNELYFSIITMTTVGYGDLLPLTISGKAWSMLITITGSFYTTIVLALIVGKFIATKD